MHVCPYVLAHVGSLEAKNDRAASKRDVCLRNLHLDGKGYSVMMTVVLVLLDSK